MIYFDNSATTSLSEAAKKKMTEAMEIYGNPSSTHKAGIEARKLIDEAREKVAYALGAGRVNPENLIFTSCGSESNNTAILGVAYAKEGQIKRVANCTFIITPYNVEFEGDIIDELESSGVYF